MNDLTKYDPNRIPDPTKDLKVVKRQLVYLMAGPVPSDPDVPDPNNIGAKLFEGMGWYIPISTEQQDMQAAAIQLSHAVGAPYCVYRAGLVLYAGKMS
jgi:hypothetical protein